MTRKDQINKLKDSGLYPGLVNSGIIPIKVNFYSEVYDYYSIRLIVNKDFSDTIIRSKTETSETFRCSEITVHRAVKYMTE